MEENLVIAICGKMASGKTYLSNLLKDYFEQKENIEVNIGSFAAPLKDLYQTRDFNHFMLKSTNGAGAARTEKIYPLSEHKEFMDHLKVLDDELKPGDKPRKHFQYIGQELKKFYGNDIWAKSMISTIEMMASTKPEIINIFIIDDLRMDIEYEELKKYHIPTLFVSVIADESNRKKIIKERGLGDSSTLKNITETELEEIQNCIMQENKTEQFYFEDCKRLLSFKFDYFNQPKRFRKQFKDITRFLIKNY